MNESNVLVVIDMQNDFVDGSLGSQDAVEIVPNVVKKIKEWDGPIFATQDSHSNDYLNTLEGKFLPIEHCLCGKPGHDINESVADALRDKWVEIIKKPSFGSSMLPVAIKRRTMADPASITIIGLCTDICVVSNALILRSYLPNAQMYVDSKCCAGTTKEKHEAALKVMESCQIIVL